MKILITCPPMLGSIELFAPLMRERGLEFDAPNFTQTMPERELEKCIGDYDGWIIGDDPATKAVRNLDWSEFAAGLEPTHQQVLRDTAAGYGTGEQAERLGVSPPRIVQHKRAVAERARAFWGPTLLADAAQRPLWRRTRPYR